MPKKITCFIGFFFLLQLCVKAQQDDALYKKYADTTGHFFQRNRPYYFIHWENETPPGLKIIRQLDERTAIVSITVKDWDHISSLEKEVVIYPAYDSWKYSSAAEKNIEKKNNERQQFILSGPDIIALQNVLEKEKVSVTIVSVDEPSRSIVASTTAWFIRETLEWLKEVTFIDIKAEPHTEISIIGYNRSFHGINTVDYSIPGANGKNIVAGVKEQKMEENDLDLYKRVLPSTLSASTVTNHATVISTIIGGAGNSFYDGRGIANGCKFFPSSFSNLFPDDATVLNTNKVTVQNHSYGTIIQQFYGAEAVSYDVQAWQNKNLVHVFSAGNLGTAAATDGPYINIAGYANLTGNFKMAKNIITVGAIDNTSIIPAESSSGPLYDGRIAPQIIALGPNGTSDAAAVVSGTVAVMQQVYADSNSQLLPAASLIRSVLYNTAEDIFRAGIDHKTGYGLLNSFNATRSIQQKEYDGSSLSLGQQWTRTIAVPANAAQLKVTLSWTDSAATANNNKALINDLDLEVIQLSSGIIYKPWVLSSAPHVDSLSKLPVRKRDSLNTAEQVSIQLPLAGNYQVKVNGTAVAASSIPFHIAFHIDTLNTFRFTSPEHTSDVNRNEDPDLDIRWRTFVADTNQTGNLYISYDGGGNWQLIKSGHKIYTNYYKWPIKDTSSRALFRMQTGFGDFFSKEFVISKVNQLNVDFICADSFRLSWNKHIYANSYKIYALVDSPYLKHLFTVADTFVVMNRSQYPSLVYAAEPVLSNGIPAARGVAQNINLQGVKCFYKTFYYNLLDQNKADLILELSAPSYVDSIFFEQVNQSGQFLQTHGNAKAIAAISIYHQLINDMPSGSSYWRVKIKLKNGAIVYTEIISILTSGKNYILFYPNPVNRNTPMIYILKQGVPFDSRLQLFDISGRLLRSFAEMPGSININSFAPGIIIYKLLRNDGEVLETGKIAVMQ